MFIISDTGMLLVQLKAIVCKFERSITNGTKRHYAEQLGAATNKQDGVTVSLNKNVIKHDAMQNCWLIYRLDKLRKKGQLSTIKLIQVNLIGSCLV